MQDYRHVLIAVNEARGPLDEGLRLALEERRWVTVVKVLPGWEGEMDLTGVIDIGAAIGGDGCSERLRLRDELYDAGVEGRVRVENGDIVQTILDVARDEKCDLIIMGSRHGSGFISRYFGGNLVDRVTRGAPCPVMVVNTAIPVRRAGASLAQDSPVPAFQA